MACRWVNSYSQLTTLIEELAIQLRVNINKRFDFKKQLQTQEKQPRTTQTEEALSVSIVIKDTITVSNPLWAKNCIHRKRILNIKKVVVTYNPQLVSLPYLSKRKEKELTWGESKIRECSVVIFIPKPFLISLLENEKVVINFINPYVLESFSTINFANTFFFLRNVLRSYHLVFKPQ